MHVCVFLFVKLSLWGHIWCVQKWVLIPTWGLEREGVFGKQRKSLQALEDFHFLELTALLLCQASPPWWASSQDLWEPRISDRKRTKRWIRFIHGSTESTYVCPACFCHPFLLVFFHRICTIHFKDMSIDRNYRPICCRFILYGRVSHRGSFTIKFVRSVCFWRLLVSYQALQRF